MLHILPFALQASQFFTSYSTVSSWLPVVIAGMLLSFSVVGVYYAIAYTFNIQRMKQTAVRELGQVIGTGIIVFVIIGMLPVFSAVFSSMVPVSNTIATCGALITGSQVNILNGFPTDTICNYIQENLGGATGNWGGSNTNTGDITPQLDYGLAAAYVIEANMTNQSVENMNAIYTFRNWIGFLGSFASTTTYCFPVTCIDGVSERLVSIEYKYAPLAGYDMVSAGMNPVQSQAVLMTEMFVAQLIFIMIFIFAWPYLLAGGMILRATIFGRGIGGLLIAVAISGLIVFPFIYLVEYTVLTNPATLPIGVINPAANALPSNTNVFNSIAIEELPLADTYTGGTSAPQVGSTVYTFMPFIFPKLDRVIYNEGCWPDLSTSVGSFVGGAGGTWASSSLVLAEGEFAAHYLIPLYGAGTGLLSVVSSLFSSAVGYAGSIPITPTSCTQSAVINTYFSILNVYGIEAVIGIFLPILNLLITLTTVMGLSGLMGGNTNILGLGSLL